MAFRGQNLNRDVRLDPDTHSGELKGVRSPPGGQVTNNQGSWRIATAGDHRLGVWEVRHLPYCFPVHCRVNRDVDIVSLPVQLLEDKRRTWKWLGQQCGLAWPGGQLSPLQCVPKYVLRSKWLWMEADHAQPSSADLQWDKTYISGSNAFVCVWTCEYFA